MERRGIIVGRINGNIGNGEIITGVLEEEVGGVGEEIERTS